MRNVLFALFFTALLGGTFFLHPFSTPPEKNSDTNHEVGAAGNTRIFFVRDLYQELLFLDMVLEETDGYFSFEALEIDELSSSFEDVTGTRSKGRIEGYASCNVASDPPCHVAVLNRSDGLAIDIYWQWLQNGKPEVSWDDYLPIPLGDLYDQMPARLARTQIALFLNTLAHELIHIFDFLHNGMMDGSPMADLIPEDHPDPAHWYVDKVFETRSLYAPPP